MAGAPSRKFTVIVADNPVTPHGGHCEHLDLFPSVFEWIEDRAFLILNVIPIVSAEDRSRFPEAFDAFHQQARRTFYAAEKPLDQY